MGKKGSKLIELAGRPKAAKTNPTNHPAHLHKVKTLGVAHKLMMTPTWNVSLFFFVWPSRPHWNWIKNCLLLICNICTDTHTHSQPFVRLIKAGLEWAHIKADLPPGLAYRETRFIRAFRILSGITYTRRVQATKGVAPGEVARRKQTTGRAYPVRSAPGHIHMESLFFFCFCCSPFAPRSTYVAYPFGKEEKAAGIYNGCPWRTHTHGAQI